MAKTKEDGVSRVLDAARAALGKVGTESLMRYGEQPMAAVEVIPTGSLALDAALGCGGLPRGRIVEAFGPESSGKTTLFLHCVAEAQRAGLVCGFVDAEHALDPVYAARLGVRMDDLLLSQPDNGEQALEVTEALVRNGCSLVVVDSVAALTPKAELEGDMGDSHVGLQARLMSQALRKLTAVVHQQKSMVLFVNQLRMKIGVMFGCFHYDARVTLADGGSMKIGTIVNQRLPVEVLSFDPETGVCKPARVTGWHDNGDAEGFLQVVTEGVGGNGRSNFGVTPNHMVFVPRAGGRWAEVPASELAAGSLVGARALLQFTPLQRQLAVASVLGDGYLQRAGRHQTRLRIGHGADQVDYCRWKQELLSGCVAWAGTHGSGSGWAFDCRPSTDMNEVFVEAYTPQGRRLSGRVLDELSRFGLAVWAMDDGSFSGSYERWGQGKFEIAARTYSEDERRALAARAAALGAGLPTVTPRGTLLWSGDRTRQLMNVIATYVPPCMEHKLHPSVRGRYTEPEVGVQEDRYHLVPVSVVEVYEKPRTRSMRRFDLTVEGHHTYCVDGVAVHNSPETTTGGNALKFYASVRLDVRRIGTIREGGEASEGDGEGKKGAAVASRTRVKVVKNKLAPPFREAEFNIVYGTGIDRAMDLLETAEKLGVLERSGSWYSFGGERVGNGKAAVAAWLLGEYARVSEVVREKLRATS